MIKKIMLSMKFPAPITSLSSWRIFITEPNGNCLGGVLVPVSSAGETLFEYKLFMVNLH